jgi:spore maturation protein CgeB
MATGSPGPHTYHAGKVKILIVADFGSPQRDEAISRGFSECGAEVSECRYGDILYSDNILVRAQLRFAIGPVLNKLTSRLCQAVDSVQPDVIFFRRPLEFTAKMLRQIRQRSKAVLCSFNNDDPFSKSYSDRRWRGLRAAIKEFDIAFAFRRSNIAQYKQYGARVSELWEPFYSPWLHRPLVEDNAGAGHNGRLLFAMHAEPDLRREAVLSLVGAEIPVDIHSWNWASVFGQKDAIALNVAPPIWGDEYARAIGNAMGTLCFFSRQNNDELTSRVFEIPACGGLLIAERNERTMELFRDGEEAVLFSDTGELVERVRELRKNPDKVTQMKHQGRERVLSSRHSVVDRCAAALNVFRQVKPQGVDILRGRSNMKKRFTEEQIIRSLKDAGAGMQVRELSEIR